MSPRAYLFNPPELGTRGLPRKNSAYCNQTHAIVEGLIELGWQVVCCEKGPLDWPTGAIDTGYDAYLVQRHSDLNAAAVLKTLDRLHCLARTAFIDGTDGRFGLDWFWARSEAHYFKTDNRPHYGVHTLPFCIHNRYIPTHRPQPQAVVFFACALCTHQDRPRIKSQLQRAGWKCEFGPVFDTGDHRSNTHRGISRYHNQTYLKRLSQCKVAVNARGGSLDCYRYWEIAASHAVLVSFPVEDRIHDFPDPPTPGIHYVPYRSIDEVNDAVAYALEHYERLHDAQRAFFLEHHRSRNRAATVLDHLGPSALGRTMQPPLQAQP